MASHTHTVSAARITDVCAQLGIPLSRFGRDAAHDPRLVFDMRAGRTLRTSTATRIAAHLAKLEGC